MSVLDGLQGNVVTGYRTPAARYVFATVRDPQAARKWLDNERRLVTTYAGWEDDPTRTTLNLAFTYDGLLRFAVPESRIAHLHAFKEGMSARRARLGDPPDGKKRRWDRVFREAHHVVVMLTASDTDRLDQATGLALGRLRDGGALEDVHVEHAHSLGKGGEHFGFADGFSQPSIKGVAGSGPRVGEGTFTRFRRWRRLALGDFVLGYKDEGGAFAPAPHGPLGDDATFMVLRKLEQHVAAFRRYVDDTAGRLGRDPDWLRAKMVGRWPNGSSIARYPDAPGPPAGKDRKASRFHYAKDREGRRCPRGAHVRRANPRDSLGWQGRLTQRHRIIRRGMSYGPELAGGAREHDGEQRGLIFICYQADIERQFEFIQQRWLTDGNSLRLGSDRDPLVAPDPGRGRMVIPGCPTELLTDIPHFVTTRGGGYYLLPGTAGLRAIAAGRC